MLVLLPIMKLPEALEMGPPKVVVAEPVTAKDEVVALVKRALVAVMSEEKKLCDEVAFKVLNWVEEAVVAKKLVPVA